jgi:hypothetical protein
MKYVRRDIGRGKGGHTSGLGGESWNWMRPILAFSILTGPPPFLRTCWFITRPSTISLSSIVPPTFFNIRIFFRSTLSAVLMSIVLMTALTAIGARRPECCETIFEEREVVAACRSVEVSVRDTGCDMSWRTLTAAPAARWKASAMTDG